MLKLPPRIEQVKANAISARIASRLGRTEDMIEAQAKQLEDCIYHPTTGLLARNKYCNPEALFGDSYSSRLKSLNKSEKIKYLKGILNDRMNSLYPKTRKLREFIIEDRRISLDSIRPCRGYSLLDKIKIFLK